MLTAHSCSLFLSVPVWLFLLPKAVVPSDKEFSVREGYSLLASGNATDALLASERSIAAAQPASIPRLHQLAAEACMAEGQCTHWRARHHFLAAAAAPAVPGARALPKRARAEALRAWLSLAAMDNMEGDPATFEVAVRALALDPTHGPTRLLHASWTPRYPRSAAEAEVAWTLYEQRMTALLPRDSRGDDDHDDNDEKGETAAGSAAAAAAAAAGGGGEFRPGVGGRTAAGGELLAAIQPRLFA